MTKRSLLADISQKQQFFDQFCAAWISDYRRKNGTLHCGKGCSGCCNLVVNCTALEACVIAQQLTSEQKARLEEQIPKIKACADQASSLKEWLHLYRCHSGACPFLEEDQSCGVYQVRPLSCRSLHATQAAHWCSTDFSSLTHDQKQAFMESLDRSVVAFPTHYVATLQEVGQELEAAALTSMEADYGCSVLGNLPWLVWLTLAHGLDQLLPQGADEVRRKLGTAGLLNPYLVVVSE